MKKILLAAFFLVLAMSLANASEIGFLQVRITIDQSGGAVVQHLVSFDSRRGESVSFSVFDTKSLRVFDSSGRVEFSEENNVVSFKPKSLAENYGVTIEYSTPNLTSKSGEKWGFELRFVPQNNYGELDFVVLLPKNVRVSLNEPQALVFAGDNGLELEWSFDNPQQQELNLKSEYRLSELPGDGSGGENVNLFLPLLIAVLLACAIILFYFSRQRGKVLVKKEKTAVLEIVEERKDGLTERQMDVVKLLGENEEKIVKALMGEDSIAQRNLMAKTGLPKSTLSRTLKRLELKGLVKISDIGHTNKIELSKEFLEK